MPRIMNDGDDVELWASEKAHELTTADICCKCAMFEVQGKRNTFADYPELEGLLSTDPAEPVGDCITFVSHLQHEDYDGLELKCVLCGRELNSHDN